MSRIGRILELVVVAATGVACGSSHSPADAGDSDAGIVMDAGIDASDAVDARTRDRFAPPTDSGSGADACADACSGERDAGPECATADAGCVPGRESFERIDYDSLERGRLITPHTFASGIAVTSPVPTWSGRSPPTLIRCDRRNGFHGFDCDEHSHLIPDGITFLGIAYLGRYFGYLELTLPEEVSAISFHVATPGSTAIRAMARVRTVVLNDADEPTDTDERLVGPKDTWGDALVELRSGDGIRKIRISVEPDAAMVFDELSWE